MAKVPDDLPVAIGQIVAGRYAISGSLGSGGMGVVLAGRHLELGERVAIKFLRKEHASHADRFFREARAAARIRSEHVVRIFDVGTLTTGEPYIVMEHLDGEDLSARLKKKGPMPPTEVAGVLLDVCQALAEAHAVGIVHRDLKPANIFLARRPGGEDLVKLLDFGVAKVPDAGSITKTASLLGSPVYMSPEQLMASRDVDARSDIWSLGIILYELLTGGLPFEGDSIVHLALVVRERPTPRSRSKRPEIPEELDDVIARCLSKQPSGRYRDVGEFAEALAPFVPPGVSHSIPRIRRVLAEGANASAALASTIPPSSDDPALSEPIPPTAPVPVITGDEPRTPATVVTAPTIATSATLAAVSSSASRLVTTGPSQESRRRRSWMIAIGVTACSVVLGLVGLVGRELIGRSRPDQAHAGIAQSAAPSASASVVVPAPSPAPIPAAETAASVPSASSSAPRTAAPARKDPRSPGPGPQPLPSATAKPAPSAGCDPPFTVDATGMRHPKEHCL